jgi:beta-carotene ketolase (CrtO type)
MEPADVDDADGALRERLERRIVNNNETILKIDCALSELDFRLMSSKN